MSDDRPDRPFRELKSLAEILMYFDRAGKSISQAEWIAHCHDRAYATIGNDRISVGDVPVRISTVWLGLDHGFIRGEAPVIFETMVFGGPFDERQERYRTEADAIAGHDKWCRRARWEGVVR